MTKTCRLIRSVILTRRGLGVGDVKGFRVKWYEHGCRGNDLNIKAFSSRDQLKVIQTNLTQPMILSHIFVLQRKALVMGGKYKCVL